MDVNVEICLNKAVLDESEQLDTGDRHGRYVAFIHVKVFTNEFGRAVGHLLSKCRCGRRQQLFGR